MAAKKILTVVASLAVVGLTQTSSHAQFGPRGGFGTEPERKLVDDYDKDGNGRLDTAERKAARAAAAAGAQGNFGFGRFGRGGAFAGSPGPKMTPADVKPPYPTTPLYDQKTLRTIFLQFENADWEAELADFFNTDVEVPATMTVDGKVYTDVGVAFRGASSFRGVPPGLKRSLNISVDAFVDKQYLAGYRTLNLLNANNDPTFMRAFLYTEIASRYIPTPKMNFVRVVINGESWGVYLNAQQFNTDFARDFFKTTRGGRWKAPGSPRGQAGLEYLGDEAATYKRLYEIKSKDDAESWQALIQLTRVLNETPPDKLEAALQPWLDVDGALMFLAIEVALVNSDGYWTRASDYNLYRDEKGRFHIIPHDVNEALGGQGGGFRGGQLDPLVAIDDPTKPLRSKLLAVPALRQRYLGYVRDIATKYLDWNAVLPIIKPAHDLIAAEVKEDTRKLYDYAGFQAGVTDTSPLKAFLDARRAYLLGPAGLGSASAASGAAERTAARAGGFFPAAAN